MAKIFDVEINISKMTEEDLIKTRIELAELLSEVNHAIKTIQRSSHKYSGLKKN